MGAGLGPACEDVIIDDNGFQRGNDCVNCDDLIKAIAGYLSVNGIIGLNGGPGVTVKNYPVEHLIVVTFSTTLACGSSSSG